MPRVVLSLFGVPTLLFAFAWLSPAQAHAAEDHWIADTKGCRIFESNILPSESATWSGACVDGFAHGEGQLRWFVKGKPNGAYTGTLSAGYLEGSGLIEYGGGDRYQGEFSSSQFDGRGVFTFANGNRFEGDFADGISTRRGLLQLTDGQHFESDLLSDRASSSPEYRLPATIHVLCYPNDKDYRYGVMERLPGYADCSGPARHMHWSTPNYLAPPTLLVLCFTQERQFTSVAMVRSSGHQLYDDQAMRMVRIRALGSQEAVGDPVPGCHMVGVVFARDETDYFYSRY